MFIVIEGCDGSGKSTQAKLLGKFLKEHGKKVLLTAEPTDGKIGRFIREILSGKRSVDPKTLALLFTADRYEHLKSEIEPALKQGIVVISERYYHSTITYQTAQGVDGQWLSDLNRFARKPDLTIFLDIKPWVAVKRTKTREIFENREFLERVYNNYLSLRDLVRIDASGSVEETFGLVKKAVTKR